MSSFKITLSNYSMMADSLPPGFYAEYINSQKKSKEVVPPIDPHAKSPTSKFRHNLIKELITIINKENGHDRRTAYEKLLTLLNMSVFSAPYYENIEYITYENNELNIIQTQMDDIKSDKSELFIGGLQHNMPRHGVQQLRPKKGKYSSTELTPNSRRRSREEPLTRPTNQYRRNEEFFWSTGPKDELPSNRT